MIYVYLIFPNKKLSPPNSAKDISLYFFQIIHLLMN